MSDLHECLKKRKLNEMDVPAVDIRKEMGMTMKDLRKIADDFEAALGKAEKLFKQDEFEKAYDAITRNLDTWGKDLPYLNKQLSKKIYLYMKNKEIESTRGIK